jgi:hypothetical protein
MPLEQVGVRLVAEQKAEYIKALQDSTKATQSMTKAVQDLAAKSSTSNKAVQQSTGGTTSSMQSMGGAVVALTSKSAMLAGGIAGLASTISTKLIDAVIDGAAAMFNMGKAGVSMAASLQETQVSLTALVSRERLQIGAAEDLNTAWDQAVPITEALLSKLRELSLTSPFQYSDVLMAFQMNKAFGASTQASLELTGAILDIAATAKFVPGVVERISYNFAQMALNSTITARDMRDLANAGLDVRTVFQEELGMSIENVNKKLKSGEMTFKEVSDAFVNYAEKNFGTAAEKMSRTFNGLISNFKDLAFFSSIDVFGPVLETVTLQFQGLFDTVNKWIEGGALKKVGIVLNEFLKMVLPIGEAGFTASMNFGKGMISGLAKTATETLKWGFNIVSQLAVGIVRGATTALVTAMNFVSSILSYWLQPHSPPKVAPDIDVWGMETMTTYLKGFTNADYSALKDVQGPIKNALSNMVTAGLIDEQAGTDIGKSLSIAISRALSSGKGMSEVIAQARGSLGPYGEQIATLIAKEFTLSTAMEAVAAAEEAVNRARQKETRETNKLTSVIDEYNALAKAGASKEVLNAKRAEFRQQKETAKQSIVQREEAENTLDTRKAELEQTKETIDLQKQLVDQLIDFSQVSASTFGAEGALGGAADILEEIASSFGGVFDAASTGADALKLELENFRTNIQNAFENLFKPLTTAFEEIRTELAKLQAPFDTLWSKIVEGYKTNIQPLFQTQIFQDLLTALETGNIGEIVKAFWRWMTDPTSGVLVTVSNQMVALSYALYQWTISPDGQAKLKAIGESIGRTIIAILFGDTGGQAALTESAFIRLIANMTKAVINITASLWKIGESIAKGVATGIIQEISKGTTWNDTLEDVLASGLSDAILTAISMLNPVTFVARLVSILAQSLRMAIQSIGTLTNSEPEKPDNSGKYKPSTGNARGGTTPNDEWSWTGEAGPEMIFPGRTSTVVSSKRILSALMSVRSGMADAQIANMRAYSPQTTIMPQGGNTFQLNANLQMPVSSIKQGFDAMRLLA